MKQNKEYIICCALRKKDSIGKYPCIENKNLRLGFSHQNIIDNYDDVFTNEGQRGFLTSELNFVFRSEAAKIAYEAGQISNKQGYLFSDDLPLSEYLDIFEKENSEQYNKLLKYF